MIARVWTRAQPGKVTPRAVATACTTKADVNLPGPDLPRNFAMTASKKLLLTEIKMENLCQDLANEVAPLHKHMAPECFENMLCNVALAGGRGSGHREG